MKNENKNTNQKVTPVVKLVPGSFSKCYYCDVNNNLCTKYNLSRYGYINYIGEYTWENYCLKNGGCDR